MKKVQISGPLEQYYEKFILIKCIDIFIYLIKKFRRNDIIIPFFLFVCLFAKQENNRIMNEEEGTNIVLSTD